MSENNYNLYEDVEAMRQIVKTAEKAFNTKLDAQQKQLDALEKEFPGIADAIMQINDLFLGKHYGNEDIIKATNMLIEYYQLQLSALEANEVFNC